MAADDIWVLIGKKLSNEATAEDLQALERFIAEDEQNRHTLAKLEQIWRISDIQATPKPHEDTDKRWAKFRRRLMQEALKNN